MLKQRVLTVALAAPFLIASLLSPWTWVFKLVVLACLTAGIHEFLTITRVPPKEKNILILFGVFHIIFLLFCPASSRFALEEISCLFLAIAAYYCLLPMDSIDGIFQRIALSFVGIFTIGTFGSYLGLMRDLPFGLFWVFTAMAMTWLNDTSAYFFGRWFGKHRLSPLISPKKSVEGFLGGALGSLCGFVLFWMLYGRPVRFIEALPMILVVAVISPIGDLTESLMKRNFGVKDSGTIIPGHGGMLDRIDALLFVSPIVYLFSKFLKIS